MKKSAIVLSVIIIAAVSLSACGKQSVAGSTVSADAEKDNPLYGYGEMIGGAGKNSGTLTGPDKVILAKGKELIAEYDIPYDKSIRFVENGLVYESLGADAITSLEKARKQYPNWLIPSEMGEYSFVDLTIADDRTRVVFPNEKPGPKAETEIINSRTSEQYYLCYQNSDIRFRINVIPLADEEMREAIEQTVKELEATTVLEPEAVAKLDGLDNAYLYIGEKDDDGENQSDEVWYDRMFIAPASSDYAFNLVSVSVEDCLERFMDFSVFNAEQAKGIYDAILSDFR